MQYALEFMRKVMLETRKYDRMTEINKLEVVFCSVYEKYHEKREGKEYLRKKTEM